MNIIVNGNILECVSDKVTISSVIEQLQLSTIGIAIAVGSSVIPQSKWGEYTLGDGAKVTIIRATQGG